MGSPPRRPISMADFGPPYSHDDSTAERKAAAQRRYEDYAAERGRQLAGQVSPHNTASERIRIWEQLHQLRLPRDSGHRLVPIIAAQTGLGVAAVYEEQRRRAEPREIAPPEASKPV
jgi:hypothetical protein